MWGMLCMAFCGNLSRAYEILWLLKGQGGREGGTFLGKALSNANQLRIN